LFRSFGSNGWLDGFEKKPVLLVPVLADARAVDLRVIHDRTLVLADAAADTEVEVDDRCLLGIQRF
jgi:hypothetical protein